MSGVYVTVRFPEGLVDQIDECVKTGNVMSRADLVRTAVRRFIEGCEEASKA